MATYRGHNNYSMYNNQQNELFGNRGGNGGGGTGAEATQAMYEQENNYQQEILASKVGQIKQIAIEISKENEEQMHLIDNMGSQFGSAGALMSNTLKKLDVMINSGGSKHMCHLILFVVGAFFFLYFLLIRRG